MPKVQSRLSHMPALILPHNLQSGLGIWVLFITGDKFGRTSVLGLLGAVLIGRESGTGSARGTLGSFFDALV